MKYISHRGNLSGSVPNLENSPDYIDVAIEQDFYVEIDVHCERGELWLGHDVPDYHIDKDWLFNRANMLFVHAKNPLALSYLHDLHWINSFWHETDMYTLTTNRDIWCFPEVFVPKGAIQCGPTVRSVKEIHKNAGGICSDYVAKLRGPKE